MEKFIKSSENVSVSSTDYNRGIVGFFRKIFLRKRKTALTLDDLRASNELQNFFERNLLSGSRFVDYYENSSGDVFPIDEFTNEMLENISR